MLWLRPDRSSIRTGIDGICSVPARLATMRTRVRNRFSSPTMEPMPDRVIGLASVPISHADAPGIGGKIDLGLLAVARQREIRSSIPCPTK